MDMVIYNLACQYGHTFEGWFPGHEAFEEQQKQGLLECQLCGNRNVSKVLSGGHFLHTQGQKTSVSKPEVSKESDPIQAIAASGQLDAITLTKAVRHYVKTNFEYVGKKFASTIQEMSRGEAPWKNVYGEATPEEQEKLAEAEIPFVILPDLPPEFEN
ncbi:MAG: DUF1178 family protein [Deltaproteobacteria bacterium]|nr:DUF1178 family protein [Deltaproteobacteria bacterium]